MLSHLSMHRFGRGARLLCERMARRHIRQQIIEGQADAVAGSDTRISSHYGRFAVILEWSWRVERSQSIYFGSFSTDRAIDNRLAKLWGKIIEATGVEGRLPELVIQLSNGHTRG